MKNNQKDWHSCLCMKSLSVGKMGEWMLCRFDNFAN